MELAAEAAGLRKSLAGPLWKYIHKEGDESNPLPSFMTYAEAEPAFESLIAEVLKTHYAVRLLHLWKHGVEVDGEWILPVSGGSGRVMVKPDIDDLLDTWYLEKSQDLSIVWRDEAGQSRRMASPLLAVAVRQRDGVRILIKKNTYNPIAYERVEEAQWVRPVVVKSAFDRATPRTVSRRNSASLLDKESERISTVAGTNERDEEIIIGAYKLFFHREISSGETQRLLRLVDKKDRRRLAGGGLHRLLAWSHHDRAGADGSVGHENLAGRSR